MRMLLAAGLLAVTLAGGAAAPVPKAAAPDPWVGHYAFIKSRDVKVTTVDEDGTKAEAKLPTLSFAYLVTKVTADRVETTPPAGKAAQYFRRDDVLKAADAIGHYTARLTDDPRDAYTLIARGWANHIEGFDEAAEADYTAALAIDRNNTWYHENRGKIRVARKRYEAALEDFDAVLARSPGLDRVLLQRAGVKASLKKYDEAIAEFTDLLGTPDLRDEVLIGRGLAHDHAGHHAQALADYDEVLTADPKKAVAWNNKGWLRATCPDAAFRDGKQAVAWATKACELTGWANAGYVDTLAAAYAEQGDFAQAVKWQREAMRDKALMKRDAAELTARLDLYTQQKPYRQPTADKK